MRGSRNCGVCPFSANVEPFWARGELLGWKSEVLREPEDKDDADKLFSATTRSDFSNTFQSLMVLSEKQIMISIVLKYSDTPTIGRKQEVCLILTSTPPDLVDLLLDFEGLQVVKFRLVRLELSVELVLARLFFALVPLEEYDSTTFVTRC